ncbi:MAG: hypothetical protein MJK18_00705 [Bdellovibrionales bacterium]|nr:hypothetical protein [Bdellovibrionales bacterium]
MHKLILTFLFSTSIASAHCPVEMETQHGIYCADLSWNSGQSKVGGNFVDIDEVSPLLSNNPIPQKWLYSSLSLYIWEKGDSSHTLVELNDLNLFPYMEMAMNHSHSASHKFEYDEVTGSYRLSQWRMQEMSGCWSLRWTQDTSMDIDDSSSVLSQSQLLTNVTGYTNVSEEKNETMASFCTNGGGSGEHGSHHDHHHH